MGEQADVVRLGFGGLVNGIPLGLSACPSVLIGLFHSGGHVQGGAGVLGGQQQLGTRQVDDHVLGFIAVAYGLAQGFHGFLLRHAAYIYVADVDVVQNLAMIGIPRAADEQQNHKHNEHDGQGAQGGQHQLLILLVEFQHLGHPLGTVAGGLGGFLRGIRQHLVLLRLQNVPTVGNRLAGDFPEGVLDLPIFGGRISGRLRLSRGGRLFRYPVGYRAGLGCFLGQIVEIQIQLLFHREGLLGDILGRESLLSGKSVLGGEGIPIQGQLPGGTFGPGLLAGLPGQIPVGLFNLPFFLPMGSGAGKFSL